MFVGNPYNIFSKTLQIISNDNLIMCVAYNVYSKPYCFTGNVFSNLWQDNILTQDDILTQGPYYSVSFLSIGNTFVLMRRVIKDEIMKMWLGVPRCTCANPS